MTIEPFGDDDPEDGWNELDSAVQQLAVVGRVAQLIADHPAEAVARAPRLTLYIAFVLARLRDRRDDLGEREPQ